MFQITTAAQMDEDEREMYEALLQYGTISGVSTRARTVRYAVEYVEYERNLTDSKPYWW